MADVLKEVCLSVTEQISGFTLEEPPARKKRIENPLSVVVLSKGIFKSKAVGVFPNAFAEAVVNKMSKGEQLSNEEKEAYFKEYINICFGRFISRINNEMGRASRFVIPVLLKGTYRETADASYKNHIVVSLMSEQGRIELGLKYQVLPEYSSN